MTLQISGTDRVTSLKSFVKTFQWDILQGKDEQKLRIRGTSVRKSNKNNVRCLEPFLRQASTISRFPFHFNKGFCFSAHFIIEKKTKGHAIVSRSSGTDVSLEISLWFSKILFLTVNVESLFHDDKRRSWITFYILNVKVMELFHNLFKRFCETALWFQSDPSIPCCLVIGSISVGK